MGLHPNNAFFLVSVLVWLCFVGGLDKSSEAATDENVLPQDPYQSVQAASNGDFGSECTCPHYSSTSSCHHPSKASGNDTTTSCKEVRIFYMVGVHNKRTMNDAVHLFRAIRDPRNIVAFHFDTKFDMVHYHNSTLKREIEECPCGSHVEVDSLYSAEWSKWSMNYPTLWGLDMAVNDFWGKWDVYINLSGDTMPVYTTDTISKLLGGPMEGFNFITSSACATGLRPTPITTFPEHWHKRSHYSNKPNSLTYVDEDGVAHKDVHLEVYFGSQWMILQAPWCKRLVQQLARNDSLACQFRDHLIHTHKLMSDETFFPTLTMHLDPESVPTLDDNFELITRDRPSEDDDSSEDNSEDDELYDWKMHAARYERMDEHVPTYTGWFPTDQRYEQPKSWGPNHKPWGPYFLGVYDLGNVRESGALFIRKVATDVDPNIYELLPVDSPDEIPPISWPNEVRVTPKPNLTKTLLQLQAKHHSKEDS